MEEQKIAYSYVRFSTPEQAKGASLARQIERAQKWARDNGYRLDETLRLDEGVSAFRSKNAQQGQLAAFLEEIKTGRIPKGSVLIVESLDRLSRADIFTAQSLLAEIIKTGVEVASLIDNKHYRRDMDIGDMIFSVVSFARANEESKTKSIRVADAWARKRSRAGSTGERMTRVIPAWLRSTDEGGIEVIPERAELVKQMFESVITGTGVDALTRWLIAKNVPPWGRVTNRTGRHAPVWHKSYVRKIITNESVTGRYTPTKLIDGKRVKQSTIDGYFPRIISDGTFHDAQRAMTSRRLKRGRTGQYNNLFRGIGYCGYCGCTVSLENKGRSPKGYQYLACSQTMNSLNNCERHPVHYWPVEEVILKYCREIRLQDVLTSGGNKQEVAALAASISEEKARRDRLEKAQQDLLDMAGTFSSEQAKKDAAKRFDKISLELEGVLKDIDEMEDQHAALTEASKTLGEHLGTVIDLQQRLKTADDDERLELRKRLQQAVSRAIKRITIYPDGLRDQVPSLDVSNDLRITIKPFMPLIEDRPDKEAVYRLAEHLKANSGRKKACFLVEFSNGHTRLFRRDPDAIKTSFMLDSEVTADTMVFGSRDFMANPAPRIKISKEPFNSKKYRSWLTDRRKVKIKAYTDHLMRTALPMPKADDNKLADDPE